MSQSTSRVLHGVGTIELSAPPKPRPAVMMVELKFKLPLVNGPDVKKVKNMLHEIIEAFGDEHPQINCNGNRMVTITAMLTPRNTSEDQLRGAAHHMASQLLDAIEKHFNSIEVENKPKRAHKAGAGDNYKQRYVNIGGRRY